MRFRQIRKLALLAVSVLAAASTSNAQTEERLNVQGFGGWALGHTETENPYGGIATPETEYNNYYFALNLAARPTDKIGVRAQAFWGEDLRGRRIELDYVFAQWTHSPALKVRVGKVLSPIGLYTETLDVGTLRPFYLVPQSNYGLPGLVTKSYLGAGLTGVYALDDEWEIGYDAFAGEMRFQPYSNEIFAGVDPATGVPQFQTVEQQTIGRDMVGGRLSLGSPARGLEFGVSGLSGTAEQSINGGPREPAAYPDRPLLMQGFVQYQRDRVSVRSEYGRSFSEGDDLDGGYLELAYKFTRHWQAAALLERQKIRWQAPPLVPGLEERMRHKALGLGLNYWLSPDMVVKLNYHYVDGNLYASPPGATLKALAGTLDPTTHVVVLGAQFSF